jgi:hypothetical protein
MTHVKSKSWKLPPYGILLVRARKGDLITLHNLYLMKHFKAYRLVFTFEIETYILYYNLRRL